ncbi:hypothetical protein BC828DRAFT_406187 [Blastocladiella britannica]|nr:hypothetical protein BC828DRAFT_406187 [Blastocladiella britannica]
MTFALSEIANARDPSTTFYGVLAALLLSHIHWHPGHPLASDTAFRIDFGHDMTESEGVAALRALLVQCMDDDIDAADKLVAGFAIIPPHAVRNGLILFVPACASESALPNMALVFAAISTDPPSFSTALEHEAFRIPLLCDAVSSTTVEQLVSVQDRGHSDRPFQSRIVLTFSPASGVPDPCPAVHASIADMLVALVLLDTAIYLADVAIAGLMALLLLVKL